ncbi:hypothetical protein [Sphingomonas profundi]|uniref:hypothetical protein n=1 Tax=Alterirhizorhabdus profundi TaxID=2681549 RepID=UPI001E2FD3AA|nr:hypothetical protein [Sphingomonas profundi]
MTQSHDRRIHADALRRQERDNAFLRFKRQAGAMLASVALGGVAAPYMLLTPQTVRATAIYVQANSVVWLAKGTYAYPTVRITYAGHAYNVPARSIADAPYYREAAQIMLADGLRGGCLGFALWVASLFLLRGATARRRERALRDRVIAGTLVTTEGRLATLTGAVRAADR